MDELIENFCSSFSALGKSALAQRKSAMQSKWVALLKEQQIPSEGWSDAAIEAFLLQISGMDGNNFEQVIGMGEREGRVLNELIWRRHFGFAHGMGRSGSLKDSQPKAVGSTILIKLTHRLVQSALRLWGFSKRVLSGGLNVMPVCTGMSIAQVLAAIIDDDKKKRKVVLLRIDQKSCIKAIRAAECEMILVEGRLEGDQIVTDLEELERVLKESSEDVRAVVSCVSCFAPRAPDHIVQISKLCFKYKVGHVINAAYGGTSPRACNLINAAVDCGRVDGVVMSLDKNFLVPVGGAIIFGPKKELIDRIAGRWPGRAGSSHIIDLFISLVSLGRPGLQSLKLERCLAFERFKFRLEEGGFEVMRTPLNDISLAIKLPEGLNTSLGAKLFHRNVSGARVIAVPSSIAAKTTEIDLIPFLNFGAHSSKWPDGFCYINVAAAVGSRPEDIEIFIKKMDKLLKEEGAEQGVDRS